MLTYILICVLEGLYLGLCDRFGPRPWQGYLEYRRECDEWAIEKARLDADKKYRRNGSSGSSAYLPD